MGAAQPALWNAALTRSLSCWSRSDNRALQPARANTVPWRSSRLALTSDAAASSQTSALPPTAANSSSRLNPARWGFAVWKDCDGLKHLGGRLLDHGAVRERAARQRRPRGHSPAASRAAPPSPRRAAGTSSAARLPKAAAPSRSISSHQRSGSSSASRRAARELKRPGLLAAQAHVADAEDAPAADGGQAALALRRADWRARTKRSPGTSGSGSARRNWTICFWPGGHLGRFQHGDARQHRGGADVQMRLPGSPRPCPSPSPGCAAPPSAIVTGATASDSQSTMPRRTSWSSSGRFSATHSPARASVASSP